MRDKLYYDLTPTEKLLLLLLSEKNKEASSLKNIDWQKLYRLIISQKVNNIIYLYLKDSFLEPPFWFMKKLQSNFYYTSVKNTYLWIKLKKLLSIFKKENIKAVPLKGITLSWLLYKNFDARGLSTDLDILIQKKDIYKINTLLEDLGYKPTISKKEKFYWQLQYRKKAEPLLDIHWDITRTYRTETRINIFWHNLKKEMIDDFEILSFDQINLLLYLCINLSNSSCFRSLISIHDIKKFLIRYKDQLDWSVLIKRAKEMNILNSLYYGLTLSSRLFNIALPLQLDKLRPPYLKEKILSLFINPKVILRENICHRLIDFYLSYWFFNLVEGNLPKEFLRILSKDFFKTLKVRKVIKFLQGLFQSSYEKTLS